MNKQLQEVLAHARADLLHAQRVLANVRRARSPFVNISEKVFLRALDRAWEAQCMAGNGWGQ